jgi:hypothetical protein
VALLDLEQMICELFEIALIIPQCVRANIALVFEMLEELFEIFVEHFSSDRRLPAGELVLALFALEEAS